MKMMLKVNKLTRHQKWIMDYLLLHPEHPDAEAIHHAALQSGYAVSLATIYRALATLHERGLIVSHSLGQGHHHYEPVAGNPHHHFICQSCGMVSEIEDEKLDRRIIQLMEERGFRLKRARLLLEGLCADCQNKLPDKNKH